MFPRRRRRAEVRASTREPPSPYPHPQNEPGNQFARRTRKLGKSTSRESTRRHRTRRRRRRRRFHVSARSPSTGWFVRPRARPWSIRFSVENERRAPGACVGTAFADRDGVRGARSRTIVRLDLSLPSRRRARSPNAAKAPGLVSKRVCVSKPRPLITTSVHGLYSSITPWHPLSVWRDAVASIATRPARSVWGARAAEKSVCDSYSKTRSPDTSLFRPICRSEADSTFTGRWSWRNNATPRFRLLVCLFFLSLNERQTPIIVLFPYDECADSGADRRNRARDATCDFRANYINYLYYYFYSRLLNDQRMYVYKIYNILPSEPELSGSVSFFVM